MMTAKQKIMSKECKRMVQKALDKITDLGDSIDDENIPHPEHLLKELKTIGKAVEAISWYIPNETNLEGVEDATT